LAWWHDVKFYLPHPSRMTLVEQAVRADLEDNLYWTYQDLMPEDNGRYYGMQAFWADDIVSNFFANIRQLLCRNLYEWCGPYYQWQLIMLCFSLFPLKRRIAKPPPKSLIA